MGSTLAAVLGPPRGDVPQRQEPRTPRGARLLGGGSGVRLVPTVSHPVARRRPGARASPWARAHFFVSQKISAISSIFASSWSATSASRLPLVPVAPASLVASLTRECSCGYFSKCGGLK